VVMSSTQVNYSRTTTATRRYDQYGNLIDDVSYTHISLLLLTAHASLSVNISQSEAVSACC